MDALVKELAAGIITALLAVIGALWKENSRWQNLYMAEQAKRLEDLKEHGRTSEMYLRALKQARSEYSDRPPPSR